MDDIDIDTLLVVGFILLIFLFVFLTVIVGFWLTLLGYFMSFALLIYLVGRRLNNLEKER